MDEKRRGEIAFLLDVAQGGRDSSIFGSFSNSVARAAYDLQSVRKQVQMVAADNHRRLSHILGSETPSEEELLDYINELAKSILEFSKR